MGLLDDAIREHLDLKRRRGGDPAEIERAEREALGPVRRNREPVDGIALEDPPLVSDRAQDEPDEGDAADLVDAEEFDYEDDELFAEGATHAPETQVMQTSATSEHTAEFDVADALAAEADAEDTGADDVLEETPEFLQDTPDHDRLWFEQRPPRDFDFDG